MEGALLTITLSITIPLFILLVWVLVIFIVVKKCIFGKRQPSENGDTVPCRLQECAVETMATSICTDEPILNNQECSPDAAEEHAHGSFTEPAPLRLPLYSTLPRNSTRPFSRDCSRRDHPADSRHGYRLHPASYSPFSQDIYVSRSRTMQALSMYCDRYITDAHYDPPPPYNASEDMLENSQLIRTVSGREVSSLHSSAYGCETWI